LEIETEARKKHLIKNKYNKKNKENENHTTKNNPGEVGHDN
jgi:hypothetical protein